MSETSIPAPIGDVGAGEGAPITAAEAPLPEKKEVELSAEETKSQEVTPAPEAPAMTASPEKQEENGDAASWEKREAELLQRIDALQKVNDERNIEKIKLELKVREEEIDLLKSRVLNLETELKAALSRPDGKNNEVIENIKRQHEELLTKARGMIFDKTKITKNQELQIEALATQVQSLKDINQITKDLLEIRNQEMKAMEDRLEAMELKFKAEKARYSLVVERAQTSSGINDDLKKEYETQLGLFKELREKYEQRVQALVNENARLKDLNQAKGITE